MMRHQAGKAEGLEFRYRFTVADEKLAYGVADRRQRRKAWAVMFPILGLAALALVAAFFIWRSGSANGLLVAALALMVAAFSAGMKWSSLWQATPVADFEPIEIVTRVDASGASNRTPYVEQRAVWAAVRAVRCTEYGIAFQALDCRWYVPRSAFTSMSVMREAYAEIVRIRSQADSRLRLSIQAPSDTEWEV